MLSNKGKKRTILRPAISLHHPSQPYRMLNFISIFNANSRPICITAAVGFSQSLEAIVRSPGNGALVDVWHSHEEHSGLVAA